jgi:mRNA interferase YafQ
MYEIRATRAYRKSYKRISKFKGFDKSLLEKVIDCLARGEKLDEKYRDHKLSGNLKGFRECHVTSDLLLVYQKRDKILVLLLADIGSHSSLFNK